MKITVLDDYQSVALRCADWSVLDADIETLPRHIDDQDELARVLADADVVVAMRERTPLPAALLERLPKLRLLVTTSTRNASIDMDAAAVLGIAVCGTRGTKASTIEHTWALILALLRNIPAEQQSLRDGGWQRGIGSCLAGKYLGLLGLGSIGGKVARIADAFDMRPIAWSTNLTKQRAEECGARLVSKEELLRTADIVSIHLVPGDRNRGLIGAGELAMMRPESFLVNTSRASIVDTAALVDALRAGTIAGAAVDVFDTEPLPADHPLLHAPNTVLTPHLGYVTLDGYRVFYGDVVEDIAGWIAGSPVRVLNDPS
ncbi:MAG: D-2-hydroxyacid dehydrogenase family protein [Pseudonocardiaceae bacterium]|nr:D-2-hydroxyacid dehydrogenase family protein [Pseudonocardiaceae bacterium]